ncbi:hypothetical protein MMC30_003930 [Trapelia coarctata]|nr:hypothetical protein [Trapelia coarctata]
MSSQSSSLPHRPQDSNGSASTHRQAKATSHLPNEGRSYASCSPQSSFPRCTHGLSQPQSPAPGTAGANQIAALKRAISSTTTTVEPAPQPSRITEVSVAAVMRLAGRLRDLDGVMGLWDDLERECKVPTTLVDIGRCYLDEIYAAVVEVKEALGEVQDLADEGSGTEEPGMIEERAGQVVERVGKWRSEQKRLLQAQMEADCGTPICETKEKDGEKLKVKGSKKGEKEVKKEKKVGKGKEREVVCLSEQQAQEVSRSFVKEVGKGLKSGNVGQEEQEILDMRKILLESIKQASQSRERTESRN